MTPVRTFLFSLLCRTAWLVTLLATVSCASSGSRKADRTELPGRQKGTVVGIVGDKFYLNGRPTYENRTWQGYKIQGLLMNARMIQGVFDDHNPATRDHMWDLTRHALTFFRTHLPFHQMNQQDNLTASTTDYCLAKPGEVYAVYLPNGGTTNLDLQKTSGDFSVQWYNPRTGGGLQNGSVTALKGGVNRTIGYPPADRNKDWVALIRKK